MAELCSNDKHPDVNAIIAALGKGGAGKGKWELARSIAKKNGMEEPTTLEEARELLSQYYNFAPTSSIDDLPPKTPTVEGFKKELSKFDKPSWDHFDVPIDDRMAELRNLEHRALRTKAGITMVQSDWRQQFDETRKAMHWEHKPGEKYAHGRGMSSSHKGRYNPADQGKKSYQTEGGDFTHGILERLREVKEGDREYMKSQINNILSETLPYIHTHNFKHLAGVELGEDGKLKGQDEFVEAMTDILENYELLGTEIRVKHGEDKESDPLSGIIDGMYRNRKNGEVITVDYKTSGVKDSLDGGNFGRMKAPTQYGETPYQHVDLQTLKYTSVWNKGMNDKGFKGDFVTKRAVFPINLEFKPLVQDGKKVKGKYILTGIKSAVIPHADNLFPENSKAHMYELVNTAENMQRVNSELGTYGINLKEPLSRADAIESRVNILAHNIANIGNALRRTGRKEMANRIMAELGSFEAEGSLAKQLSGSLIFIRDAYRMLDSGVHMDKNQLSILNHGIQDLKDLVQEFGEESLPEGVRQPVEDYVHSVLGIDPNEPLAQNLIDAYEDNIHYISDVINSGLGPKMAGVNSQYADRNFKPVVSDIIWKRYTLRKVKKLATDEAQRQLKTDKYTKEVEKKANAIYDEWMNNPDKVEIYKADSDKLANFALGLLGKKVFLNQSTIKKTIDQLLGQFTVISDQQGFTAPIGKDIRSGTETLDELQSTNPDPVINDYVTKKLSNVFDKVTKEKEVWAKKIAPMGEEIIRTRKDRPYEYKVDHPYGFMIDTEKRKIRKGKEFVEVDYPVWVQKYDWSKFNEEESAAMKKIEEDFPIKSYDISQTIQEQQAKRAEALAKWREENMTLAPEFGGDKQKASKHVKEDFIKKLYHLKESGMVGENNKVLDKIIKNAEASEDIVRDFENKVLSFNRGQKTMVDVTKDRAGNILKEHVIDISQTSEGDIAANMFFDSSRDVYVPRDEKYQNSVYRSLEALPEGHIFKKFYKEFSDFMKFHDAMVPPEKRQGNNLPNLQATGRNPEKQTLFSADARNAEYRRNLDKEGGSLFNVTKMDTDEYKKKWLAFQKSISITDHDSRSRIPLNYSGVPQGDPENLSFDLASGLYAMAGNLTEYMEMVPAAADIEMFLDQAEKSRYQVRKDTGTTQTVANPYAKNLRDLMKQVVYKEREQGKLLRTVDRWMSYKALTQMMYDVPMQIVSHFASFSDLWAQYGGKELKHVQHLLSNVNHWVNPFTKVMGADGKERVKIIRRNKALSKFMGMNTMSEQFLSKLPKNWKDQMYTDIKNLGSSPRKWLNFGATELQNLFIKWGMVGFSFQDSTIKSTVSEAVLRSIPAWDENGKYLGSVYNCRRFHDDGTITIDPRVKYTDIRDLKDEYKQVPVLNDQGVHLRDEKGNLRYKLEKTGKKTGGVPFDLTTIKRQTQKIVSGTTTQASHLDRAPILRNRWARIIYPLKTIFINSAFYDLRDRIDDATGKRYPSPIKEVFRFESQTPVGKMLELLHNVWLSVNPLMGVARKVGMGNLLGKNPEHMDAIHKLWASTMIYFVMNTLAWGNWDENRNSLHDWLATIFPGREERKRKLKSLKDASTFKIWTHRIAAVVGASKHPLGFLEIFELKSLLGLFEGDPIAVRTFYKAAHDQLVKGCVDAYKSGPYKNMPKWYVKFLKSIPGGKGYLKDTHPNVIIEGEKYQMNQE